MRLDGRDILGARYLMFAAPGSVFVPAPTSSATAMFENLQLTTIVITVPWW